MKPERTEEEIRKEHAHALHQLGIATYRALVPFLELWRAANYVLSLNYENAALIEKKVNEEKK